MIWVWGKNRLSSCKIGLQIVLQLQLQATQLRRTSPSSFLPPYRVECMLLMDLHTYWWNWLLCSFVQAFAWGNEMGNEIPQIFSQWFFIGLALALPPWKKEKMLVESFHVSQKNDAKQAFPRAKMSLEKQLRPMSLGRIIQHSDMFFISWYQVLHRTN